MYLKRSFYSVSFLLVFFVKFGSSRRLIINAVCIPPRGDVCIEIRNCPYFADLLDRSSIPRPHHVIKLIRKHQCGFIDNTPKVCCEFPTPVPTILPVYPEINEIEEYVIEKDLTHHANFKLLPNEICGTIPNDFRITSGTKTNLGEFPWMALIAYYTSDGIDFRCGGSVINERYVLTAAHCILNATIIGVRLGEHNINTMEDCDGDNNCASPVQDFYIEKTIVHPLYDSKVFANDIALLRLATTAKFTLENVQPLCLPFGVMSAVNLTEKFAIIAGWGVTETGHKSPDLLKASVPVVSNEDCQNIYKSHARITDGQLCAGGYNGKDSCGGDSGGPLMHVGQVNGATKYIQYGIVSYGPRHCGSDGQPGIYTRVTTHVKWILDNLQPTLD